MFNYPGEYAQLPWGVCLNIVKYLGEYFYLPRGVYSTTLGSIFNYPGKYVQLPWGVFSTPWIYMKVYGTPLASILDYEDDN